MDRPYIICRILSALDGRIAGPFMGTPAASAAGGEYARVRDEYQADAWLYGQTTTREFLGGRKPDLPTDGVPVPDGDFAAKTDAPLYYVSIDTEGEMGWTSGTFQKPGRPDAHVIEVLTQRTPAAYKAYLRSRGVSYILAGEETLDCRLAAEKLHRLFGIQKVLICGGGRVNWSFLQQGVVDELSLLLAPAADGEPGTATVFERMAALPESGPVTFQLQGVQTMKDSVARLVYTVENGC